MTRFAIAKPSPQNPNARVIAVVNQKGGVGKTTTAMNLAASLALEGVATLLIDCDPQANATSGFGFDKSADRSTIYEVLLGDAGAAETILDTSIAGLALLPGSRNLIGANLELVGMDAREQRLKQALEPVLKSYQLVILDCPPALDLLTLNALVAADRLLVPMQAEYFALEGISELIATLDRISASYNPSLGLEGVLLTMYDERTNLSQQVRENLRVFFGEKLYRTTIPRNVRLAEAPSHGQPAVTYDPRSRGAEAYRELTREFMLQNGLRRGEEHGKSALASPSEPPSMPDTPATTKRR